MTNEQEIKRISQTLGKLLKEFQDIPERKKMLKKAAKPMVNEIKALAPVATGPIARYGKADKLVSGIRAPKGSGKIIEWIEPERLKKSIGFIPLRRSSDIHIGPRGMRKKLGAPYYAGWEEFGTIYHPPNPYLRPGYESEKGTVLKNIETEYRKKVGDFGNRHSV